MTTEAHDARRATTAVMIERAVAAHPSRTALIVDERRWSYQDLFEQAARAAGALVALGVRPGDRVAVLGRNSDAYVIAWLATQVLGAIHVPVNYMLGVSEVGYIVRHSEAAVAFADPDLYETLSAAIKVAEAPARPAILAGSTPPDTVNLLELAATSTAVSPSGSADDIAQIAYTSGTESDPKGAMLTHGGLVAQYLSCIVAGEYAAEDRVLHALPLYHCAQMHCFLMPSLAVGATGVLLPSADPTGMKAAITRNDITSVFAPPTVWIGLLEQPGFDTRSVPTLSKGYYGASIMPVPTLRLLAERLPTVRLWNYYGQTELGPLATVLGPSEQLTRSGSAGRPVLNVRTRVVDEDMRDVAPGEIGEIVHRSPQLLHGYYRDEVRTREAFAGGWFHSGDLATRDADGYITIVDRKKDMINSGGENVSSREVEEVLYGHPDVVEVAVVGVPDPKWIETVVAAVVPRDHAVIDQDALCGFARERLAAFKVPKRVVAVEALPKNPSGKILKRELRDRLADR